MADSAEDAQGPVEGAPRVLRFRAGGLRQRRVGGNANATQPPTALASSTTAPRENASDVQPTSGQGDSASGPDAPTARTPPTSAGTSSQPPPPQSTQGAAADANGTPGAQQALNQHLALTSSVAAALAACLSAAAAASLLIADVDRVLPLAIAVGAVAFASILFRVALAMLVPGADPRLHHQRLRRATRNLTGERAAYVRTSQRLAMLDRDFTAADYEMLLDLDNNSQRLRQFLEGASQETIERLPTYRYKKPLPSPPPSCCLGKEKKTPTAPALADDESEGLALNDTIDRDEEHAELANTSGPNETTSDALRTQSEDPDSQAIVEEGTDSGAPQEPHQPCKEEQETVHAATATEGVKSGGETATHCTICLEPFEDGMQIRILPCFHQFMAACIDPWLLQQAKCPICKGNAIPDEITDFSGLGSS